jgi:hypothetical protein
MSDNPPEKPELLGLARGKLVPIWSVKSVIEARGIAFQFKVEKPTS